MGETQGQLYSVERKGRSGAFLAGRMPQLAPAAPEPEKVVRFLCRCYARYAGNASKLSRRTRIRSSS